MKAASVAVVLLVGCSLVTDTRSLTFRDDLDANGDTNTDAPATADADVGTDDARTDDAAPADCTCVPSLPGWEGPVRLDSVRLDSGDGPLPACSGAFPVVAFEGNRDLTCTDASCAPCSCEVSGAVCPPAQTQWFEMRDCAGANTTNVTPAGPACDPFSFAFGNPSSVIVTARVATEGTCRASGGDPTIDPVSWRDAVRACATGEPPRTDGCGATEICAPHSDDGICFHREGDVACPAEYPERHLFHAGFEDVRSCTACACEAFVGEPCTGNVAVYSNTSCTGGHQGIGTGVGCVNFPNTREAASFTASPPAGTCAPTGGVQSGSCAPTSPTTFCCLD